MHKRCVDERQGCISALLRLGGELRKACLLMEEEGGPEGMSGEVVLPNQKVVRKR